MWRKARFCSTTVGIMGWTKQAIVSVAYGDDFQFKTTITVIVANRPGMAGTVPEFWALSLCPGGIQVVPEFMRTLRFGFHSLRWPPQSQSCLV